MLLRMVQKQGMGGVRDRSATHTHTHKDTMVIRTKALRDVHFLTLETMNV